MFLLNQGEKVDATKKSKFVRKAWFCTLCLGFFIGCSAHRSDTTEAQYQNHWYTSIDGHFSVQTPKSLEYRQDALTIHTENKSFTMNLGVHHGNMAPWYIEVIHTEQPAFWQELSTEEKSWWIKAMVEERYKPFTAAKETSNTIFR